MATTLSPSSKCSKLLVAAIDFGTTYSGYAFSFKHEYEKEPTKVSSNSWTAGTRALVSLKTPTTLLLNPQKKFDSFGYEAEDKYSDMSEDEDEDHEKWYFYSRFKMMLFEKIGLKRNIMLDDNLGRSMPALDIFSMSIGYLKTHLMQTLHNRATGVTEDDVQWVLTVPAIWNDAAKQFMREAAEKAGINGDNLIIALEPEAASMYCINLPLDRNQSTKNVQSNQNTQSMSRSVGVFLPNTKYMVVDVGGGTVDITVHQVLEGGSVKELHKASGGAWGGTRVDEAFRQLLIKIIGANVLHKFQHAHTADYIDMFREFETKKRNIKEGMTNKVTFKVPISLKELFEEMSGEKVKEAIEGMRYGTKLSWSGDKMRIAADMIKELFDESLNSVVDHIKGLLKDPLCGGLNKILLVGGFSESPLLQSAIKSNFSSIQIIIPQDAGLAVLKGAVLYGHNPEAISARRAKYCYGVRVYRDFERGVHPEEKKYPLGNGKFKCKDVFAVHVRKGQELKVGEAQNSQRYTPLDAAQTSMIFDIYTSTEDDPIFVTDPSSSHIGQLEVDVPDTSKGKERGVWCGLIFGGTELMVHAKDEKTNKITKAKFNFLH